MTDYRYLLCLGDDSLVATQRLLQWCTVAPQIEEDIALSNIALDQLGQARALLSYAGELEGAGRDEDALAYLRDEQNFTNVALVELPNEDFAVTVAKMLAFSTYQHELYDRLRSSGDARISAIAVKAGKEVAYHLDHFSAWAVRLGDGTPESHARMTSAIDAVWPWTHELFRSDPVFAAAAAGGYGVDPVQLRPSWLSRIDEVLVGATVTRPADGWAPEGARAGLHTEHFGFLLAEMQSLHRAHAGVSW